MDGFTVSIVEPTTRQPLVSGPHLTHSIANYPRLRTSYQCSLFLGHYSENREQNSRSVERLTFLHVGSDEASNVSSYSETCTAIEFRGHISSASAVFGIVKQLPRLQNVTIFIGSQQGQFSPEYFWICSECPSVETLKIVFDRKYFNDLQHGHCDQSDAGCGASDFYNMIVDLAESIIFRAKDSFPNLKNLVLELPENWRLRYVGLSLILSCPSLKETAEEGQIRQLTDNPENNQVLSVKIFSDFNPNEQAHDDRDHGYPDEFHPYYSYSMSIISTNHPTECDSSTSSISRSTMAECDSPSSMSPSTMAECDATCSTHRPTIAECDSTTI